MRAYPLFRMYNGKPMYGFITGARGQDKQITWSESNGDPCIRAYPAVKIHNGYEMYGYVHIEHPGRIFWSMRSY